MLQSTAFLTQKNLFRLEDNYTEIILVEHKPNLKLDTQKSMCVITGGQRLKTSALTYWTFYNLLYVPPYLNDFLLNCAAVPPHYDLNMYRHSRWFKNSCKCLWKKYVECIRLFQENFNDTYSNLQLTTFYVSVVRKYPKWIILFITGKRTVMKHVNLESKIKFQSRQYSNRCHLNYIWYTLE